MILSARRRPLRLKSHSADAVAALVDGVDLIFERIVADGADDHFLADDEGRRAVDSQRGGERDKRTPARGPRRRFGKGCRALIGLEGCRALIGLLEFAADFDELAAYLGAEGRQSADDEDGEQRSGNCSRPFGHAGIGRGMPARVRRMASRARRERRRAVSTTERMSA